VKNQRAAAFSIGDRIRLNFSVDGKGDDAATGTVTRTLYSDGYTERVDVKWDEYNFWRTDIHANLIYPARKPLERLIDRPRNQRRFAVGDRVTATNNAPRHKGLTGTVKAVKGSPESSWYTVEFDGVGTDFGGLWDEFLTLATPVAPVTRFKAGDRVTHRDGAVGVVVDATETRLFADAALRIKRVKWEHNPAFTRTDPRVDYLTLAPVIKRGDTVVATDVPGIPRLNGKRGTVVSGPNRTGSYVVDFPGDRHYYAKVRPLTPAEVEADRKAAEGAKALEAERIAKRVALGKVEKLQRLAKELGYTVHKIA
jgi:hypothetical protein